MKRLLPLLPLFLVLQLYSKAELPNILFILSDDQAWETLGLHGGEVKTPNLDRLAAQGTLFTHAYNMGGWHGAVCVASRTMLNTGRSIWRAQAAEERIHQGEEETFWAEHLSEAGYTTYMSGKWHVRKPAADAFDHVAHVRPGMPKTVPSAYFRPDPTGQNSWAPDDKSLGGFWEGGKHWSEVVGDDGVAFLKQAAGKEEPFFMYLAFNAPHDPRQSPKAFVDMYPVENVKVPENFLPDYPYKVEIGCYSTISKGQPSYLRDEKLAPWPRTEEAIQLHRQEYYAIITHMDKQVGRILKELEASGQKEETIIIFTSDHGLAVGRHGLMGKQNMYEHSLRVPLIIAGRDIPAGKQINIPVYLQDVMPTSLQLAGQEIPHSVEFKSLLPLLAGEETIHYPALYGAMWPNKQRAIIKDGWKLMHYPKGDIYRLYNLQKDPLEMDDLANDPNQAERVVALKAGLRELQLGMEDPLVVQKTP
ncbi:MAG: sulfatase-like hydrolase/transferase [Puniceicoccaceae bacterium]